MFLLQKYDVCTPKIYNQLYNLVGEPLAMEDESPLVVLLNQKIVTKEAIEPESYVALAGIVGQLDLAELQTQVKHFDTKAVDVLVPVL